MELKLFLNDGVTSAQEAYFLGFVYADGYIPKPDKYGKSRGLIITLARKDEAFLRSFRDLIGVGTIKLKEVKVKDKVYPTVQYSYWNTIFVTKLVSLGIVPRKTYLDSSLVFDNIPDEFKWDFIRGYFDGDGCIHSKSLKIGFVSLNEKLLEKIRDYVNPQISHIRSDGLILSKDKKYFRLRSAGARIVFSFLSLLYKNNVFCMDRKFSLFKNLSENHVQEKASKYLNLAFKGGKWHVKVDDASFGSYADEIIAAEVRDKVALHLYGDDVRLNFPDKKEDYLKINLENFYKECNKKRKTKYKNIYYSNAKKCWVATGDKINGKRKYIGQFETEELAFQAKQNFLKNLLT